MHIKRCVVKDEREISHAPDDGNGCCCARWRGNRNVMCDVQRGRGSVLGGLEMQVFIISDTLWDYQKKLTLSISLHVWQLCKDQEDLLSAGSLPVT